ncbi:MAG: CHAT domain-containing tetratricopeptide repeat protein [Microcoleus sp.]
MNEARRQAYQNLIESLITCTSEEEIDILQANLELIDDGFAQYLREWATEIMPTLDAEEAYNGANFFYGLNISFKNLRQGSRASNLEVAIACLEIGLTVVTREAYSEKWAKFQNSLATAYQDRIRGEKAQNLELAIAAFEASLEVYTRDAFPFEWARSQNNLAMAYLYRIRGEKAENLELAIAACEASLEVYTRDAFPFEWATCQNNLAGAYQNRIRGEKAENLELAIAACEASLEVYTRDAFPFEWARSQNNLASAYHNRIRGEKAENLELAIAACEASLEVYTPDAFPFDWARSQNNLASAYLYRIRGEKAENLELAIAACEASLEVYTRDAFPEDWARSQNNLGMAYLYRIRGEKAENLELAIAAFEASLEVRTRDAFPIENARTLYNLGVAYQENSQLPEAYNTFNSAIETVESMRSEIIIGGEADRQKLAEEWNKLYQSMVEVCLQMENSTAALEYVERSKTRNLVELFHKARSLPSQVQRISFAEIRSLLAENEAILEWYITYNGFKVFIVTRDSPQPDIWQSSSQDLQALEELQQEYLDDIKDEEKYDNWKNQLDSRLEKLAEILHIDEIISRLPENCQKLILVPFRYLHLFPLHALTSSRQKADKTVETGCLLELFPGGVRYTPSCQLLQLSQRVNLTAEDTSPSKFFAIQNPTEDLDFTDIEVEAIAKSFNPAEILSRQNASKAGLQQQIASLQNADIAHFSCHGFFDFLNPEKSALILAGAKVTPLNPPLVRGETGEETPPLRRGGAPVPAPVFETHTKSWKGRVGTGALPLQNDDLSENETALGGAPVPAQPGVPSEEKRYIRSRRGETYDIVECLTLEEIFDLELSKCRLVALSACETGLTDARNTTDEYIGLTSGFFYAGATSILSTLWAVNDVSTAILTIKFYELFRGETQPAVAVALRESQLWLRSVTVKGLLEWVEASKLLSTEHKQKIQDKYRRGYKQDYQPYESPVYWAAFCAVGQ